MFIITVFFTLGLCISTRFPFLPLFDFAIKSQNRFVPVGPFPTIFSVYTPRWSQLSPQGVGRQELKAPSRPSRDGDEGPLS